MYYFVIKKININSFVNGGRTPLDFRIELIFFWEHRYTVEYNLETFKITALFIFETLTVEISK